MPAVQAIAKENDALLVSDEMICGFGRTGKWFGCEHSGVVPDVVTMGKGLGNGFPVSGLASTEEITQAKPWGAPSGSSSSYGGNPMAGAAILASVTVIEEERLVENAAKVGAFMLRRFREMQERYEFIGDVRGKGLLIGVELVKDRTTKEPLAKEVCVRLFHECLKRGLVSMVYSPSFRVNPPLTIDEGTADNAARDPRRGLRPAGARGWLAVKLRGALLGAGNIALRGHAPQWTGEPSLVGEVEIVAVADLSAANLAAARAAVPAGATLRARGRAARQRDARLLRRLHAALHPPRAGRGGGGPRRPRAVREAHRPHAWPTPRRSRRRCARPGSSSSPATSTTTRPSGRPWCGCCRGSGAIHLVEYEVHRTEANPGNPNWTPAWRTDRALAGGGILFDHGAHIFYQLRSVLGEPAAVQATVRTLSHADYGVEDSAFVVARLRRPPRRGAPDLGGPSPRDPLPASWAPTAS